MNFQTKRFYIPIEIGKVMKIDLHCQTKILKAYAGYLPENPSEHVLIVDYLERWGSQKYNEEPHYLILLEPNMSEPVEIKSTTELILSRRGSVHYDGKEYYLFLIDGMDDE